MSTQASKRLSAVVSGGVQGVSFRAYTQREARRLGLTGWVRNLPTGEVELIAEGDEARLADLERWLHRGPSLAQVERVDLRYEEATHEFPTFEVRR